MKVLARPREGTTRLRGRDKRNTWNGIRSFFLYEPFSLSLSFFSVNPCPRDREIEIESISYRRRPTNANRANGRGFRESTIVLSSKWLRTDVRSSFLEGSAYLTYVQ